MIHPPFLARLVVVVAPVQFGTYAALTHLHIADVPALAIAGLTAYAVGRPIAETEHRRQAAENETPRT